MRTECVPFLGLEAADLERRLAEVEARLAGPGGARQPEAPSDTMDKHPS